MLKYLSACVALAVSPMIHAETIAEQNFNQLDSSGTFNTDSVTSGSALTNASSFNTGGEGLDFQTFWFDTRGTITGPVDADESSDFIGANSFAGSNSPDVSAAGIAVTSGFEHNFEFNDADGRLDLVFEPVDLSGFEDRRLSLNYWVSADSFEDGDALTVSISDGTTSVELFSALGEELVALSGGDNGEASEWQPINIDLEETIADNNLGDTITLTIGVDNNSGNENIFVDDILFSSGDVDDSDDDQPEPVDIGACNATDTADFQFISAVQGSGESSPLDGQSVIIEGVVTGLRNNGFFIQEEVADEDTDSTTSEGVFVFFAGDLPAVNSTLRLAGTVDEFFDLTQVTAVTATLDCSTETIPTVTSVSVALPMAEGEDLEHYEGMIVSVSDLTVFDTGTLLQFGEVGLSNEIKRQPTDLFAPLTPEYNQQVIDNAANIIYVEDNISSTFPDSLSFFSGFSYANPISIGDSVTASGPLNFSFGLYRINPTEEITVVNSREAVPDIEDGDVSVASFNVLNYFNGEADENGNVTFDFDSNRGAESEEEFALQEARIVEAIVGIDADVLGLIELENDGFGDDSAIQSLVTAVNAQFSEENQYSFITTADESIIGSDAITVGIFYRDSVVTPTGDAVVIEMPQQLQSNDSSLVQMRDALLQTFTHTASEESFAVAVNHFKSKGSGCFEDSNDTTDIDSIQGSCNALRVSASVALGNALAAADLPERVMILGDLNSYAAEDPIAVLTDYDPAERGYTIATAVRTMLNGDQIDAGESVEVTETFGFQSVAEAFDPDGFSFWFFGSEQAGSLDHILASPRFMDDIVDATHWNINSVEVFQFQYDQALANFRDEDGFAFTDIGPFRSSDHDPFIVTFNLASATAPVDDSDEDDSSDNGSGGGSFSTYLLMLGLGLLFVRRRAK